MSVLLFLAVTFGAGTAALLTRRRPGVSIPIGIAGLAAATVSGLLLSPGDRVQVGETALVVSEFQRLFLLFASVAGLSVSIIALTGAWQRNLASAMLIGLGALALGLGLADPVSRLAATAAAGLPGVLVAISTPVDGRGVRAAARELRAVAVTGALAVVAAALVSGPVGLANLSPTIVGLAYLAMALAVAVRIGAIPFHTRVARVTGSAPGAALPLLLAWAPAGFAAAALVWVDWNISTTAIPLEPERLVIVAVGVACIILGIVAATIQDDIEHVVGYSVIQDAGFVMLALAILDIAAWEPARSWLLIYVATKSAFAGWALAMRDTFGTGRIGELSGWVRRAPFLALALAVIVVATVGVPGLLVFDVRSRIASLALGDPLAVLAIAGGLGSLLYYGRLARVGMGPVAPMVAAYPGIRPRGLAAARATAASATVAAGGAATSSAAPGSVTFAELSAAPAVEPATASAMLAAGPTPASAALAVRSYVVATPQGDTAQAVAPGADAGDAGRPPVPAVQPARRTPAAELSALRRDPGELTRAWAREALERAGLSPTATDDAEGRGSPATAGGLTADGIPAVAAATATAGVDAADGSGSGAEPDVQAAAGWGSGGEAVQDGSDADARSRARARRTRAQRAERAAAAGGPGSSGGPDGSSGADHGQGRRAVASALWSENRPLVATTLALLLAGIGLVAAAGGFGVAEAARAPAPLTTISDGPFPGSPSGQGQPGTPDASPASSAGPDGSGQASPDAGSPGASAQPGDGSSPSEAPAVSPVAPAPDAGASGLPSAAP